jgi:hypothetical protein
MRRPASSLYVHILMIIAQRFLPRARACAPTTPTIRIVSIFDSRKNLGRLPFIVRPSVRPRARARARRRVR